MKLQIQQLDRKRYRAIVVEQDSEPRLKSAISPLVNKYLFAYNPGPFNKGRALNIGVCAGVSAAAAVCLMDADMLNNGCRTHETKVTGDALAGVNRSPKSALV